MSDKHRRHEWRTTTEDGLKREMRVTRLGKAWRFQSKIKGDEMWTYHDTPSRADLEEFLDVLQRKYQRRRVAFTDVESIQKMLEQTPK